MNIQSEKKPASCFLLVSALTCCVMLSSCTHPHTPAGHEGYVFHIPLVFGKAEHRQNIRGPASTGISWRLYVINVDMRARSYKEDFKLLTKDNLSVEFEVNTRISLRPNTVKLLVEEWGGKSWYPWNVKEQLRTVVRNSVTQVSAIDIQRKTNAVKESIFRKLTQKYKETPVQIESVDIGNIQFPKLVTKAIERKIGQQQELKRQEYLLSKTKKEADIRILEAVKAARQQLIISSTLDPLYVQRRAVQVYRMLAESSSKTVVVLPISDEGTGIPLVLKPTQRKETLEEGKKLLDEMERKYLPKKKETTPQGGDAAPGGTPISLPPSSENMKGPPAGSALPRPQPRPRQPRPKARPRAVR